MIKIEKEHPQLYSKGYHSTLSGDWDPFGYIFNKLAGIDKHKLNTPILRKVIQDVEELRAGRLPAIDSFLPKGFEDKEASMLSEADFLKYVEYRYRYNLFPVLKRLDEYPPCVQIEPTSMCNFRCVMCYQIDKSFSGKSNGHMGMMSLDTYKLLIDELEGKVEAVTLASRGEPLMHPQIKDIIEYTGNKFLGFKINTNASLLTEDLCHTILQAGVNTLVFSVDAADKNTYEKIRINGNFDKVKQNIIRFHEIRKTFYPNSQIITKVSGVLISSKQQTLDTLVSFWKDYCDDVAFVPYNPWESSYTNEVNNITTPCTDLWRRLFVWYDGRVNPCDYDYKTTLLAENQPVFPNMSIREIWNSTQYNKLRKKHLRKERGDIEPCKRCVFI